MPPHQNSHENIYSPEEQLAEIMREHGHNMRDTLTRYDTDNAELSKHYKDEVRDARPAHASVVFARMNTGVHDRMEDMSALVGGEIHRTAQALYDTLPESDRAILNSDEMHKARQKFQAGHSYSIYPDSVFRNRQPSSRQAEFAMGFILNVDVLAKAREESRKDFPNTTYLEQMINQAQDYEGSPIRQGIVSALDIHALDRARLEERKQYPSVASITHTLQHTSSQETSQLINSALDVYRLNHALQIRREGGVSAAYLMRDVLAQFSTRRESERLAHDVLKSPAAPLVEREATGQVQRRAERKSRKGFRVRVAALAAVGGALLGFTGTTSYNAFAEKSPGIEAPANSNQAPAPASWHEKLQTPHNLEQTATVDAGDLAIQALDLYAEPSPDGIERSISDDGKSVEVTVPIQTGGTIDIEVKSVGTVKNGGKPFPDPKHITELSLATSDIKGLSGDTMVTFAKDPSKGWDVMTDKPDKGSNKKHTVIGTNVTGNTGFGVVYDAPIGSNNFGNPVGETTDKADMTESIKQTDMLAQSLLGLAATASKAPAKQNKETIS